MSSRSFAAFFRAVHGRDPFPWQARLADEILFGRGWPEAVMLPTGSGKTCLIDIAVYCLAEEAQRPARRTPRRIFFVIDRRSVVDQAFEHAAHLAEILQEAVTEDGVLGNVARQLLALGGSTPLQAAVLRGGMFLSHDWARDPVQPLVCATTVDQVGSRLLFRGYGLSRRPNNLLPLQAALVGMDALLLLDEAHMSTAFAETLQRLVRYRSWAERAELVSTVPWLVVRMSATLADAPDAFRLDADDYAHSELGRRLAAAKPARLIEAALPATAETSGDRDLQERLHRALVDRMVDEARQLLEEGRMRVIGVVVNRVRTARDVFRRLEEKLDEDRADLVLLTGRIRPLDRDRHWQRLGPRLQADRVRSAADRPLVVVATQAIEVGVDLDLDALVTECAPLDALRQRFGRLNRLGRLDVAPAAIVIRADQARSSADDPVYGEALGRTWQWLRTVATPSASRRRARSSAPWVNFGVLDLEERLPPTEELQRLCTPARPAPVLLPGHLDLWVQTSPPPRPDPDIAFFLHGPEPRSADVQLVWRADLDPEHPDGWAEVVGTLPPVPAEALPVPVYEARRYLTRSAIGDFADVEGSLGPQGERTSGGRRALRWDGPFSRDTRPVSAADIRPGDTLVLPADYGGADEFGWDPARTDPVPDVAELAYRMSRGLHVLRFHWRLRGLYRQPSDATRGSSEEDRAFLDDLFAHLAQSLAEEREDVDALAVELLKRLAPWEGLREDLRSIVAFLLDLPSNRRKVLVYPDGQGLVIGEASTSRRAGTLTDEDDATTFTQPTGLTEHLEGVARQVDRWAKALGLPPDLRATLVEAARCHDLGKLDPRFQLLLYHGDEVAAVVGPPRAKSGLDPRDPRVRRFAWPQSGLPRGYRHEATSLTLVSQWLPTATVPLDPDLFLHLVASHHGCARPFFPPVDDRTAAQHPFTWQGFTALPPQDGLASAASGVPDRFWRLVRRYGWYGLAWLEAILRLADHRESEREGDAS
jgi:CRISPR-associated endonuclease/helicase Cas3